MANAGRVSGSIYHGGHDHYRFLTEAYGLFAHANVLQRDMYPSATKLEGEIVAMTASLLHGDAVAEHHPGEEVCGVVTFGGTESLINPMLVYRERGRVEKGITEPEVIIPVTAHVALQKAAHMLGIRLIQAPVRDDWRADVDWMRDHVTPNTVAIVGSAGNYPHGLIDPIEEMSALALEHDLGLHVDGCMGGFILPWAERLGYPIPVFDFRLPGVTSHLRGHPQVRIRAQGHVGAALSEQHAAPLPVLQLPGLAGRHLHVAGAVREPFRRRGRGGMGRDAEPRRAGIPRDRGADLRDRGNHPRGRRGDPRARGLRRSDVHHRLPRPWHRHLPRQRLPDQQGLASQRAAAPARACTSA